MKETVLIVEDDSAMLRGLRDNFDLEGYLVKVARTGKEAIEMAESARPDLIILDVMLPEVSGFEVCHYLREGGCDVPIILLTAKSREVDVVMGLKLGADDYVTKPFSIRELLARADAFLRRRREKEREIFEFGNCRLEVAAHVFTRDGAEVKLSPKEFELLHYLAANPGRVLTRERILQEVWGADRLVTPRSVDRFVTTLRQRVEEDPHHPRWIETVREFGYKFTGGT